MPKVTHRKIYDDSGEGMIEGDEVIVNGEHERIIYFDDAGEIQLENWNWEDFVFSIRKKQGDDRYEDIDEPILNSPTVPQTGSQTGKYR